MINLKIKLQTQYIKPEIRYNWEYLAGHYSLEPSVPASLSNVVLTTNTDDAQMFKNLNNNCYTGNNVSCKNNHRLLDDVATNDCLMDSNINEVLDHNSRIICNNNVTTNNSTFGYRNASPGTGSHDLLACQGHDNTSWHELLACQGHDNTSWHEPVACQGHDNTSWHELLACQGHDNTGSHELLACQGQDNTREQNKCHDNHYNNMYPGTKDLRKYNKATIPDRENYTNYGYRVTQKQAWKSHGFRRGSSWRSRPSIQKPHKLQNKIGNYRSRIFGVRGINRKEQKKMIMRFLARLKKGNSSSTS
jgi:hypothetical protein